MEKISIIGLGKLGLCLAACYAKRGFQVLGIDINKEVVDKVNSGKAPWHEPGLDEILKEHGGSNLKADTDGRKAIEETDISIILTATPSNPNGTFSNKYIKQILNTLSQALLKNDKPYHLFIISSTVMPGSIEKEFIPLIESFSGRILNKGFGVGYDPDFVALGNVIKGFLEPEMIIIGQSDPEVGYRIERMHAGLCINKPVISKMSLISAELAKVCLNAYITMKISFANVIANLCEKIPNADPDHVTQAIGADKRISPYYFKGGLAFGGTCFPRDAQMFHTLMNEYKLFPVLASAIKDINFFQDFHLKETVFNEVKKYEVPTVAVLGLSFTANTPVIIESSAIKLISKLLEENIPVIVYDPHAMPNVRSQFDNSIIYAESEINCITDANVIIIIHRSDDFKKAVETMQFKKPVTIIDCWRIINPEQLKGHVHYIPVGKHT